MKEFLMHVFMIACTAAVAVCPVIVFLASGRQERYREHGRRTGEW